MPIVASKEELTKNITTSSKPHRAQPKMDNVSKIVSVLSSYPSRPALAAAILSGQHIYSSSIGVPFSRALLWKTSLLQIDTIRSNSAENSPLLDLSPLKEHRKTYDELSTNIEIPWHLLPKDSIYYRAINENNNIINDDVEEDLANLKINNHPPPIDKPNARHKHKIKSETISSLDCPLSNTQRLDSKNESDLDILTMIIADVERLFPEHPEMFINSEKDKVLMIEILYRYAKWINEVRENEGRKKMSYVQGMHELCGVIYAVLKVELVYENTSNEKDANILSTEVDGDDISELHDSKETQKPSTKKNDSKTNDKLRLQIREFLSSKYFQHDVFSMFQQLMSPIIDKYFTSSGIVRESIIFDLKLHHVDVGTLKHPGLATALKDSHIESQLWLTRWFRMILTREVGLAYSVRVWDGLIAYACVGAMAETATNGHDISVLLPYVIILLTLRVRSVLLKSLVPCLRREFGSPSDDDTEALSVLLHYPFSSSLSTISRSVSPGIEFEEAEEEHIMMYRKTKDSRTRYQQKLIFQASKIPKMPSAIDLFSDAAHICGLSDTELQEIGPSLIKKYSNGDIYDLLKDIGNSKPSTPFFDEMLKNTKSWNILSTSTTTKKHVDKSVETVPDSNRSRLEKKLQQKVQNRLRDRSTT